MHIYFKKIPVHAQAYVKLCNMMTHIAEFQLICHAAMLVDITLTSFFIKIVLSTSMDTA